MAVTELQIHCWAGEAKEHESLESKDQVSSCKQKKPHQNIASHLDILVIDYRSMEN